MALNPALLEQIRTNDPGLTSLHYRNQNISKNDTIELADALKSNRTLATLDLSYNRIGDDGACILAGALEKNTNLASIDLWNNAIGDAGTIALAGALKDNDTLTKLDLGANSIGEAGAITLTSVFIASKNILYVNPATDELVAHYEKNIAIAKDLVERIQDNPGGLTRNDRKEIKERIPAILYIGKEEFKLSNETVLEMLVGIGIKPAFGSATQKVNAVREAQRQAALDDPSQGI